MATISIITVNYNNAAELERTLQSVRSQTIDDYEHILIDGGSTDDSLDIIKRYGDRLNYWCSEPDGGIYQGMNKGIAKATGDYLIFLNSGDMFHAPDVLERALPYLHGTDLVYGDLRFIDPNPAKSFTKIYPDTPSLSYLIVDSLPHPGTFIHRRMFANGGYDTRFPIVADWEFWCRKIIYDQCSTKHIPLIVSTFFLGGMSSQEEKTRLDRKAAYDSLFPPMIAEKLELQALIDNKGLTDVVRRLASTKKLHRRVTPIIRAALAIDKALKTLSVKRRKK